MLNLNEKIQLHVRPEKCAPKARKNWYHRPIMQPKLEKILVAISLCRLSLMPMSLVEVKKCPMSLVTCLLCHLSILKRAHVGLSILKKANVELSHLAIGTPTHHKLR